LRPDRLSTVAAAVLYVKDRRAVSAFYEQCFEMSMVTSDGDDVSVLASDEWELSLVVVPEAVATKLVINEPPERRARAAVKLAFHVTSIDEVQPAIIRTGGQSDPIETAWQYRGYRHLDCLDPEGNVVELRERLAAPS
jgi:predicted enzyme related to lactoylglutathione lyase